MTIHVEFVEHPVKSGRGVDYTFLDRHTKTEIAIGTYSNGMFEVMDLVEGNIKKVNNAGMAFVMLNRKLANEYGY
jgi:hypothetical protein